MRPPSTSPRDDARARGGDGLAESHARGADRALKDPDLVATEAGAEAAPIAAAIAERWRRLVHDGSSGLDVSAARLGLGPEPRDAV